MVVSAIKGNSFLAMNLTASKFITFLTQFSKEKLAQYSQHDGITDKLQYQNLLDLKDRVHIMFFEDLCDYCTKLLESLFYFPLSVYV